MIAPSTHFDLNIKQQPIPAIVKKPVSFFNAPQQQQQPTQQPAKQQPTQPPKQQPTQPPKQQPTQQPTIEQKQQPLQVENTTELETS